MVLAAMEALFCCEPLYGFTANEILSLAMKFQINLFFPRLSLQQTSNDGMHPVNGIR
jgi:hypothetical protein